MSAQLQVTGEAKIRDLQGPVVANAGVITALDGAANQYVRGDGTLASFPTSGGGGSSVSYYLNGSVNQGTFGGSTYYQMSKNAIVGTGTNFSTSANGLLAQFITDANDPDVVSIPSGNWNVEFFMSVSASSGALASFYVEIYKYDGTNFTLLATNVATPEELTHTTTVDAYFTSVAMPLSSMAVTDRLAIRIYANVASKTVTLYTEDNRLCEVVTTFSKGILSVNNLTDQSQYLTVGTSGTDFNIVSSGDTHTFNIPSASASNRGLITIGTQTIAGNKTFTGLTNFNNSIGVEYFAYFDGDGASANGGILIKQYIGASLPAAGYTSLFATPSQLGLNFGGAYNSFLEATSLTANRTYTFPDLSGTIALLEGTQTFSGSKTFSTGLKLDLGLFLKESASSGRLSGYVGISTTATGSMQQLQFLYPVSGSSIFSLPTTGSYNYEFPIASGTIALTSNLSSYVPYTGATTDLNLGLYSLYANSLNGGALGINVPSGGATINLYVNSVQKAFIAAGSTYLTFASQNTGGFTFQNSSNATIFSISNTGVLGNGTYSYTLPSASGTIALTSNLSAYLPLTGGTLTGSLGINSTSLIGYSFRNSRNLTGATTTYANYADGQIQTDATNLSHYFFSEANIAASATVTGIYHFKASQGTFGAGSSLTVQAGLVIDSSLSGAANNYGIISNINAATNNWNLYIGGTAKNWIASSLGIGAGLSNPTATLDVNGTFKASGNATFSGDVTIDNGSADGGQLVLASSGYSNWNIDNFSGSLRAYYGASEKMRLTSGGLLLLGTTTSNGALLQVAGSGTFSGNISIGSTSAGANVNAYSSSYGSNGVFQAFGTDGLLKLQMGGLGTNQAYLYTGSGNKMTFFSGGNTALELASTGAATFSSSVTAGGNFILQGGTGYLQYVFNSNAASRSWRISSDQTTFGDFAIQQTASQTGSDFVTKFYINPNGNVGIGTSSPSQKLQIEDTNPRIRTKATSTGFAINYVENDGGTLQTFIDNSTGGGFGLGNYVRGLWSTGAYDFVLTSNATERMRITSGGNVLINKTSNTAASINTSGTLQVNSEIMATGSSAGLFWENRSGGVTTNSNWYGWYTTSGTIFLWNGSSNIAQINQSTGIYTPLSDINKKKDFENSTIGLNAILGLKPTLYRMKTEDESVEKQLGFIAQEVKDFIPQAYVESEDFIGLNYNAITAGNTKAIQELYELVLEQNTKIEELKALIAAK